jgi:hypothetical protein
LPFDGRFAAVSPSDPWSAALVTAMMTTMADMAGRRAELTELVGAMAAARAGHGSLALVTGEAGIGKTRLMIELEERAAADGSAVAWGVCRPESSAFAPWAAVLRSLLGEPLPPAVAAVDPLVRTEEPGVDTDRRRLFEAVIDALRRAAQPALIVLDDLHWVDADSLSLLAHLAAELIRMPVLVVGCYRADELAIDRLPPAVRSERQIDLAGLDPHDLSGALRAITQESLPAEVGGELHRRTSGNPFFSAELVRLLRGQGWPDSARLPQAVPESVRVVLERRLARLPSGAERLLAAGSVLGDEFDGRTVAAIAGVDPASWAAAAEAAVGAQLLVARPTGRHAVAHALIGEVLRAGLGRQDRRRLHERAAGALLATGTTGSTAGTTGTGGSTAGPAASGAGADLAAVARHFAAAAELGGSPADAVEAAAAAAAHATARAAYGEAALLLGDALRWQRDAPRCANRGELLLQLGAAQTAAGAADAAGNAYKAAADEARAVSDPIRLARAALGLGGGSIGFEVGWLDGDQIAMLREALAALDAAEVALRTALLARLSVALTYAAPIDERRGLAEEAVRAARELGEPAAVAVALSALCDAAAGPDDVRVRLSAATEAIELARDCAEVTIELLARRLRFVALAELGDWTAVDREITAYALACEPLRQPRFSVYVPLWRGLRALMLGDDPTAMRCTREAKELARLSGSRNGLMLVASQEYDRLVLRGRPAEAWQVFEPVFDDVSLPSVLMGDRAVLRAVCAPAPEARSLLDRLTREGFDRLRDSEWLIFQTFVAEAALRVGHRRAAGQTYAALRPYPDLFVIDGIGAACFGRVGDLLARLEPLVRSDLPDDDLPLDGRPGSVGPEHAASASGVFRLAGEVWELDYAGRRVQLKDSKGLRDLARLLARPHQDLHVAELVGGIPDAGDAGPVLDERAIAAYRRRLRSLQEDLEEAIRDDDLGRLERLQDERDALLGELGAGSGLGGRARRASSATERVRKTVRFRINTALRRIAAVHPELGRHLAHSVRTGTFCRYDPEQFVRWQL